MSAEPHLSSDEPRIVDGPESWLAANLRLVAFLLLFALALAIGLGVWWQQRSVRQNEAARLFAEATTPEAWNAVLTQYPGTPAAALSLLRLASEAQERQAHQEALDFHQRFLRDYPRHPLVPVSEAARAQLLEALNRNDEARAAYQAILDRRPEHPLAGAATIGQARLLIAEGETAAARQKLSDFIADQRDNPYLSEASRLLQSLPPAP